MSPDGARKRAANLGKFLGAVEKNPPGPPEEQAA